MTEEETLTGAPRGTAYHRVMELLDFEKMYDRQTLEAEINTFVEQGEVNCEKWQIPSRQPMCWDFLIALWENE